MGCVAHTHVYTHKEEGIALDVSDVGGVCGVDAGAPRVACVPRGGGRAAGVVVGLLRALAGGRALATLPYRAPARAGRGRVGGAVIIFRTGVLAYMGATPENWLYVALTKVPHLRDNFPQGGCCFIRILCPTTA